MATYNDVISAIIKKQMSIIGSNMALKSVKDIAGLTVAQDGTATGGDAAKLTAVVASYEKIAGTVALMLMKGAIAPYANDSGIVLPANLK
ncbi:MAG TPA: hypothetical protein DEE98_06485 [Elusimicrobia bacterium]|nr:MAG: hypothetical protein A2278_02385 [Elusimicrobia bacterium RIFOXYA12_FULL_49_49]OGS06232.1 MAG: hypothetical protein A2204_02305 [Elusimicrobia bacterium RIFOXYA1_FULL_47_7]OGS11299.1 MAG: hypothetical protein A2386_04680 [Elusimicrobia bacterium RIFOXYB1_FULL_48_9]OGS16895.1 MAG: hypothetical protein A2251_05835 [Elusimicrobia bacterium RIFOXYA2_FULL_47_53]OGS32123.1 MAG: hypothetical protein A2323_08610 [Elusimicrobia bacterium RIFOXYB2_FULL_46_23]HBU70018.1 hypothetical protein [Elus